LVCGVALCLAYQQSCCDEYAIPVLKKRLLSDKAVMLLLTEIFRMKETKTHNERMAKLIFASVYPHYVTKVERKGRTIGELHQVIEWLTGFDAKKLKKLIDDKVTFETFFERAKLNPNA
jgi:Uncharacterized protein conserved in bacteria (DUF2200)